VPPYRLAAEVHEDSAQVLFMSQATAEDWAKAAVAGEAIESLGE
jgi:hypothetical protein